MFYFTCNESKIYESFTFWNNLQEIKILIYWDAPVYKMYVMCVCVCVCVYIYIYI